MINHSFDASYSSPASFDLSNNSLYSLSRWSSGQQMSSEKTQYPSSFLQLPSLSQNNTQVIQKKPVLLEPSVQYRNTSTYFTTPPTPAPENIDAGQTQNKPSISTTLFESTTTHTSTSINIPNINMPSNSRVNPINPQDLAFPSQPLPQTYIPRSDIDIDLTDSSKSISELLKACSEKLEKETSKKRKYLLEDIQREFGFTPTKTLTPSSSRYLTVAEQDAIRVNGVSPCKQTNVDSSHGDTFLSPKKRTKEDLLEEQYDGPAPVIVEVRKSQLSPSVKSILKRQRNNSKAVLNLNQTEKTPLEVAQITNRNRSSSSSAFTFNSYSLISPEQKQISQNTFPSSSQDDSGLSEILNNTSQTTGISQPSSQRSQSLLPSPKKVQFQFGKSSFKDRLNNINPLVSLSSSSNSSKSSNKFSKFYSAFKLQLEGTTSNITVSTQASNSSTPLNQTKTIASNGPQNSTTNEVNNSIN